MEDDKAIEGTVKLISNKTAHVVLEETEDELDVNKITAVVTVGREPRTNSEQKKRRLILDVLRGTAGLESKLFEGLWLPTTDRPCLSLMNSAPTRRDETASLNRSQRFAVESMITDGSTEMPRVVVVRGEQ